MNMMTDEASMKPNETLEYRFEDAVQDPTLWEGYEQWLDEQASISDFELWHEENEYQGY
jgi:hypothetical protein